jgi:hypothetical protein
MKSAIALLALAIAPATPAAADNLVQNPPLSSFFKEQPPQRKPLRLNPPPEYDHPYTGYLIVQTARDQDEVRRLCNTKFTLGVALACSYRREPDTLYPKGSCTVVILPEAQLTAAGLPLDLIWRHEIAHCNGWPGDHKGALPIWALIHPPDVTPDDTDTPTEPPRGGGGLGLFLMVMDAASKIDNFGINAVGKTVAEVANNLAQSNKTVVVQFVTAAKAQGLSPKSKITAQILSNPATARPLAKALGIGANLRDDHWQDAHAIALAASRARGAAATTPQ